MKALGLLLMIVIILAPLFLAYFLNESLKGLERIKDERESE